MAPESVLERYATEYQDTYMYTKITTPKRTAKLIFVNYAYMLFAGREVHMGKNCGHTQDWEYSFSQCGLTKDG